MSNWSLGKFPNFKMEEINKIVLAGVFLVKQKDDYLIFFANGRRPQFFRKWKKTSNFRKF